MKIQEYTTAFLKALSEAKIGGKTALIVPTITTTSTQYTSGDCVGGLIKHSDVFTVTNGTAILKSLHVKDASGQGQPFTILLFNQLPTGMTTTDNSAFAYGSGNGLSSQIAKVDVMTSDYETIDSKKIAHIDALSTALQSVGTNSDLYMVIVTTGTPTYGANSTSLSIVFGFLQD